MSASQDKSGVAGPDSPLDVAESLPELRLRYHSILVNALVARGATAVEAEDLLADLWGDCIVRADGQPSLLHKFSGKCPVQTWLLTVATHRLVDLKRRQKHRGELARDDEAGGADAFDRLPAPSGSREADGGLVELLRETLQAAFARCPAEAMLMLRLVFLNGLSQREVGRMWGWHESKVSRCLTQAMSEIEGSTLRELKKRDPWLELAWADFLELCESHEIGFL